MVQLINVRKANQHLSQYIDAVQNGEEVIITRRGVPVAKLTAYSKARELSEDLEKARKRCLSRMQKGYPLGGKPLKRDSIHER